MSLSGTGALVASLLIATAGCGSWTAHSERNDAIPIPAGATFGFLGNVDEGRPAVIPDWASDVVPTRIQEAITTQLAAKGYKAAPADQAPTFGVRYFVGSNQRTSWIATTAGVATDNMMSDGKPTSNSDFFNWSGGIAILTPHSPVTNVQYGVELVQMSSGQTAWRGVYKDEAATSPPSAKELNDKVTRLFKRLPHVPGTTPPKN